MGQNARKSLDRGVNRILKGVIKKRRPRDTRRRAHQLEHLEDRRLLAADVMWAANTGILEVSGSSQAETISIATENGSISVDGIAQGILAANVNELRIEGGDGNDVIDIRQLTGLSNASIVVMGGAGNDTLLGSPMNDQLQGGEGDDYLEGFAGDDNLIGGAGADTYVYADDADLGNDAIDDSGTLDTLDFSNLASPIDVDLSSTTTQTVAAGGTLSVGITMSANSISGVIGTPFDDNIEGNSLDNQLVGGAGADSLVGKAGSDTLDGGTQPDFIQGGPGDDIIIGGGSNDSLFGDGGADSIVGDGGNDLLSGGSGNDELIGEDGSDVLIGGPDVDVIDGGSGQDSVEFLDEADGTVSLSEGWALSLGHGLNGVQKSIAGGIGEKTASWRFRDLPVDSYEVFVSWEVPAGMTGVSTNTPIAVIGGAQGVATLDLNQSVNPAGPIEADRPWESLGVFAVTDGVLDIQMSNDTDGIVIADAVRIVPKQDAYAGVRIDGPDESRSMRGATEYKLDLLSGPRTVSEWQVDWGDGTVETLDGSLESATHLYSEIGDYEVAATAVVWNQAHQVNSKQIRVNYSKGENLIENGFLTDGVPSVAGRHLVSEVEGWELSSGSAFETLHVPADQDSDARNFLLLDRTKAERIQQTVKTIPGTEYYLAFDYMAHADSGTTNGFATMGVAVTDANTGTLLESESLLADSGVKFHGISFVASGTSTTVGFYRIDDDVPPTDPDPPIPDPPNPDPGPAAVTITEYYSTFENTEIVKDNLFDHLGQTGRVITNVRGNNTAGGILTLAGNGDFSFDPVTNGDFSYLAPGQSGFKTVTYKSVIDGAAAGAEDATWRRLTIRVVGVNTPPTATHLSIAEGKVEDNTDLTLSLNGASDVDGEVTGVAFYREGNGDGQLSIGDDYLGMGIRAAGSWRHTLPAGLWESASTVYYAIPMDNSSTDSGVGTPVKFDLNTVGVGGGVLNPVNQNLIQNGTFESPVNVLDIQYRNTQSLNGWQVASGGPLLEIQRERQPLGSEFDWLDGDGNVGGTQWAELDSRTGLGKTQPATLAGEYTEGSITTNVGSSAEIYQDINVDIDRPHELSFAFGSRPDIGFDNHLRVQVLAPDPFVPNKFTIVQADRIYSAKDDLDTNGIDWANRAIRFTPKSAQVRVVFSDVGDDNETGTFLDNVSLVRLDEPTLEIANLEPQIRAIEGYGQVAIEVSLAAGSPLPLEDVTIHYRTAGTDTPDSALPFEDFTPQFEGTVLLEAGQSSTYIVLDIEDDGREEPLEYFTVEYYAENANLVAGDASGSGAPMTTIEVQSTESFVSYSAGRAGCVDADLDGICDCIPTPFLGCDDDVVIPEGNDDPPVQVTIAAGDSIREGDGLSSGPVISVSGTTSGVVRVYFTAEFMDGSAPCNYTGNDYSLGADSIGSEYFVDIDTTLISGQTDGIFRRTLLVTPFDDIAVESTEMFNIELTNAVSYTPTKAELGGSTSANITIEDNEESIQVNLVAVIDSAKEGDSMSYRVVVDEAPTSPQSVMVQISDGSATFSNPGGIGDYDAQSFGPFTFRDGFLSHEFSVAALEDAVENEPAEQFNVEILDPDSCLITLGQSTATGNIASDVPLMVGVTGGSVDEADVNVTYGDPNTPANFEESPVKIWINSTPQGTVEVPYSIHDASAESSEGDFQFLGGGTATFTPSEHEDHYVTFTITGDTLPERDEQFIIKLGTPIASQDNVEVEDKTGDLTIRDDDNNGSNGPEDPSDGDKDAEEDDEDCCECSCDGGGGHASSRDGSTSQSTNGTADAPSHNSRSSLNKRGITNDRIPFNFGAAARLEVYATHEGGSGRSTSHFVDTSGIAVGESINIALDLGLDEILAGQEGQVFDYTLNYIPHYDISEDASGLPPEYHAGSALTFESSIYWPGNDRVAQNGLRAGLSFDFLHELRMNPTSTRAYLLQGDGSILEYKMNVDGEYEGGVGVDSSIRMFNQWSHVQGLDSNPFAIAGNPAPPAPTVAAPFYVLSRLSGEQQVFDNRGRHLADIDSAGNTTLYDYTADGKLSRVIDAFGRATNYDYDPVSDLLHSITEWHGAYTEFTYHDGRVTVRTAEVFGEPLELLGVYYFNGSGEQLQLFVDGDAPRVSYEYDAVTGLLTAMVSGTNGERTEVHSSLAESLVMSGTLESPHALLNPTTSVGGRIATMTDGRGYSTTMRLDVFGNVVSEIDSLGNETIYVRDEDGRVLEMHEPDPDQMQSGFLQVNGNNEQLVTKYEYDDRGNLKKITRPDATFEEWFYETDWNVPTKYVDAEQNVTTYDVNLETGLVERTQTSLRTGAAKTGLSSNEWQNSANIYDVDRDGFTTASDFYLVTAELDQATDGDRTYTSTDMVFLPRDGFANSPFFDVNDNGVFEPRDPFDVSNAMLNNAIVEQTIYTTSADGLPVGLVKATIDPLGLQTNYIYYDDITTDAPYEYGQLRRIEDPSGRVIEYRYDELGRMLLSTQIFNNGAGAVQAVSTGYQYDVLGRQAKVTIPRILAGHRTLSVDEIKNHSTFWNNATITAYTDEGQIDYSTDPLDLTTDYTYDTAGRMIESDVNGRITSYVYDLNGNLQLTIDPMGLEMTFHYDAIGRQIATLYPHETDESYSRWQNPIDPYDVNADGMVDGMDREVLSLAVAGGADPLASWPPQSGEFYYYDVNGDGNASNDLDAFDQRSVQSVVDRPFTQTFYDNASNVIAERDAMGGVTQFRYDELHRRTHVIQDNPDPTATPITSINLTAALPDPAIHATEVTSYDNNGRPIDVFGPRHSSAAPQVTSFIYDAVGRVVEQQQPRVVNALTGTYERPTTKFGYDQAGNILTTTDPHGVVTRNEYDEHSGLMEKAITAATSSEAEQVTEYVSWDGRLQSTINHATGAVTTQLYNALGLVSQISLPTADDGNETGFQRISMNYDKMGNRASQLSVHVVNGQAVPVGDLTQYFYTDWHELEDIVGAHPTSVVASTGRPVTHFEYNGRGQQTVVTDPEGRTTEYKYDLLARLSAVLEPDFDNNASNFNRPQTHYGYDANGNRTSVTQGDIQATDGWQITTYTFDRLNRVIQEDQTHPFTNNQASTFNVSYGYDLSGNRDQLIDADVGTAGRGNLWTWTFDAANRPTSESVTGANTSFDASNLPNTRSFAYDLLGNLVEKVDREDRVTIYDYDERSQLRNEHWFDDSALAAAWRLNPEGNAPLNTISFDYDVAGRMVGTSDQDHEYSYLYDDLNRLRFHTVEIADAASALVNLTYDVEGNRDSAAFEVQLPNQSSQLAFQNEYEFDHLNRLTSLSQGDQSAELATQKSVEFTYYLDGRLDEISRDGHLDTKYLYDAVGRLDTLSHREGVNDIQVYDYGYDQSNRVKSIGFAVDAFDESVTYQEYNRRSELTFVDRDSGLVSYDYDENGNRIDGGIDNSAELNRLEQFDGVTYEYDDEGNRTERIDAANSKYTYYFWDHRNRLSMVQEFDGPDRLNGHFVRQIVYGYDALNQMISRQEIVGTAVISDDTYFVYDQGQIVMQLDGSDGTATEVDELYMWGPNVDRLMAVDSQTASDPVRWALSDHQGTIRDWADSSGSVVEHLVYDAFGNLETDVSDRDLLFAYTGRLLDQGSGLQNNLNRWYDAEVGRWVSEDPIGFAAGDSNLYRYVGNSPTNYTDPNGQEADPINSTWPTIRGYWEAWQVVNGVVYGGRKNAGGTNDIATDTFTTPNQGRNTCGKISVVGKAKFVSDIDASKWGKIAEAGFLPAIPPPGPPGWSDSGALHHELTISWASPDKYTTIEVATP